MMDLQTMKKLSKTNSGFCLSITLSKNQRDYTL